MRDRLTVVYVDSCRLDPTNVYQPDIGSTRPVLSTSIGRALLLGCSAEERTAVLNRKKKKKKKKKKKLRVEDRSGSAWRNRCGRRSSSTFRRAATALSPGEWRSEIHAIAAPIRMQKQEPFALNCSISALRDKDGYLEREVAPKLLEAVRPNRIRPDAIASQPSRPGHPDGPQRPPDPRDDHRALYYEAMSGMKNLARSRRGWLHLRAADGSLTGPLARCRAGGADKSG